jgi:hypothetical protein
VLDGYVVLARAGIIRIGLCLEKIDSAVSFEQLLDWVRLWRIRRQGLELNRLVKAQSVQDLGTVNRGIIYDRDLARTQLRQELVFKPLSNQFHSHRAFDD